VADRRQEHVVAKTNNADPLLTQCDGALAIHVAYWRGPYKNEETPMFLGRILASDILFRPPAECGGGDTQHLESSTRKKMI